MARGPQSSITCPVGAIPITAGSSIQAAINANANGTTFCLGVGTHPITGNITPKTGNTFVGQYGAILDGSGWVTAVADDAAFKAHNVSVQNVTFRNLVFQNMPQRGIHAFGGSVTGWVIEYCEIKSCRTAFNFGSGVAGTGGSHTVQHNLLHHNNRPGFTSGGYLFFRGDNSTIEDNEIAFNGGEQKLVATTGCEFRGNWVHHNLGDGIWYDTSNYDVLIEDNLVEDNVRFGIHHEISGNAIIRNNTVNRNADHGIIVVTSRDTEVYGNVLTNNFRGIDMFVKCSVVGQGDGYDLSNVNVHDNVITLPSGTGQLASMLNTEPASCTPAFMIPYLNGSKNLVFQGNVYYVPNLTTKYWWWQNLVTKNFTEWQALGNDTTGSVSLLGSVAAMSKGNTFENDLLKLIFWGTPIANLADNAASGPLTNLYLSLHTADPGDAADQTTNETSYGGYARLPILRSASGWTITGNVVSPVTHLSLPACTSGTASLSHAAIGTALSGTGKVLYKGALTPSLFVAAGVTPRLLSTSTITED